LNPQQENFRIQKWVVTVAVLLFLIKIIAFFLTRSVAILTDALESTVNVIAGFVGLYSLYIASKPKDTDHPYGHGKAEFLSAAVEGTMIIVAGFIIIYEAIDNFIDPHDLQKLDWGILLVTITAAINYVVGFISLRNGKKNNSLALIASGKHLQSDAYSTLGLVVGLAIIYFTGKVWLDSAVAILFAFIIIYTGYKILRSSIAVIMDEADSDLLKKLISLLNSNRRENWVDLHNLRVIKYGGQLHVDCHLTIPWYLNISEAHQEIDFLTSLVKKELGDSVEFFVHTDPCLDFSCSICTKADCSVRKHPYKKRVDWTLENTLADKKHRLSGGNS